MPGYLIVSEDSTRVPAYAMERILITANTAEEAWAVARAENWLFPNLKYRIFDVAGAVAKPMVACVQRKIPAPSDGGIPRGGSPIGIRGQDRPAGERDQSRFADLPDAAMAASPEPSLFSEASPSDGITEELEVRNGNVVDSNNIQY